MRRFHLFEFHDLQWFPGFLRDYMTDYLQFVTDKFDAYSVVMPLLEKGVERSGNGTIVDLASGGGGGMLKISKRLKERFPDLKVVLTDFYPNEAALQRVVEQGGGGFSYARESVNALDVPKDLKGFRTMFLSFHHFRREEARQILQNAVDAGVPIGVFEGQERSVAQVIQFLFSPIFVLLLTPFIPPFRLGRLFFTYIVPLVPLFGLFDGVVSALRTYTPEEMQAMADSLEGAEDYEWEIGIKENKGMKILYMVGTKK